MESSSASSAPPAVREGSPSAGDERMPTLLLVFVLCCVSALEGADTALLPASFQSLEKDLGLKLTDIAYLNVAQMVATQAVGPIWGVLADRGTLSKKSILVIGALGQGLITIVLAVVTSLTPMIFLRALNGALLAALRPISNGIIADATCEEKRGQVFARVQSALFCGMLVSTMTAVPLAGQDVGGIDGWRVAFVLVGLLSVVVSGVVVALLVQPSHEASEPARGGCGALLDEIRHVGKFLRIPTFCVIITQGVFGTIPWSVMGNMVMYLQKCGVADTQAAVLASAQLVSTILGNLIGGYVADVLASRLGRRGRPLNAQISVLFGILPMFLFFYGISPEDADFGLYLGLILVFGLLGTWAQSGTNFPILSEIVPSSSISRVMAWEGALENSIAQGVGPPTVALIATSCFGYDFDAEKNAGGAELAREEVLKNARALGTAMAAVICLPWLLTFLAYGLLYCTYPRDVGQASEVGAEEGEPKACTASAKAAVEELGDKTLLARGAIVQAAKVPEAAATEDGPATFDEARCQEGSEPGLPAVAFSL